LIYVKNILQRKPPWRWPQ